MAIEQLGGGIIIRFIVRLAHGAIAVCHVAIALHIKRIDNRFDKAVVHGVVDPLEIREDEGIG